MPFPNPVVGGGGDLIRHRVRSPGYIAGTTGWSINQDGSAEFLTVIIRGTFTAETGGNSLTIVQSPFPRILFNTSDPDEDDGASVGYSGLGSNVFAVKGPDFGQGSDSILFEADPTTQVMTIQYQDVLEIVNPGLETRIKLNDTAQTVFIQGDGGIDVTPWIRRSAETWQTPSYNANWSGTTTFNGVAGFQSLQFRRDAEDNVWLYGACTRAAGAGLDIFTLPTGYRPASNRAQVLVNYLDASAAAVTGRLVQVLTNGNVSVATAILGVTSATSDELFFNGKFPLGNIT